MRKEVISLVLLLAVFSMPFSLAGVGIKWERESIVLEEGGKACISYGVYNPWPTESYVAIELSESLSEVLISQEAETKLIPGNTASSNSIPIEFCFEVPQVYEKDCFLGGLCKQECSEEQKLFVGEVLVKSVPNPSEIGGSGGSATQMVVSAPLRIRVLCNPYERNLTAIYVLIAVISLGIIIYLLHKKFKNQKVKKPQKKSKRNK
jgi:hypothetical protein